MWLLVGALCAGLAAAAPRTTGPGSHRPTATVTLPGQVAPPDAMGVTYAWSVISVTPVKPRIPCPGMPAESIGAWTVTGEGSSATVSQTGAPSGAYRVALRCDVTTTYSDGSTTTEARTVTVNVTV